jgi:hypothetical protein
MKSMKQRVLVAAAVVCASTMAPAIASAGPVVPKGEPFSVNFSAGVLCAFDLNISGINGQTLHDSGHGVILLSGPFAATFTNLSTGAAKSYNISGPTLVDKNGVVSVTGPNVILQPSDVGTPFVLRTTGRVIFTPENTIASIRGTVTDVCALLS